LIVSEFIQSCLKRISSVRRLPSILK